MKLWTCGFGVVVWGFLRSFISSCWVLRCTIHNSAVIIMICEVAMAGHGKDGQLYDMNH